MNAKDLPGFSGLSLVPLDEERPSVPASPTAGPAKFHANTRDGGDRRVQGERRQQLRMTADRRSGKDRRPRTSWEPGKNL
jgi:hypothetical protein